MDHNYAMDYDYVVPMAEFSNEPVAESCKFCLCA